MLDGFIASTAAMAPQPIPHHPLEGLEPKEGPLWNTIKGQLYSSEVSHVKKLVGESLIRENKLMWDEITSLRQMLQDFQRQNEELPGGGLRTQVQVHGSQHREMLRRQLQITIEDVQSQATVCGRTLEDLVPELKEDRQLYDFIFNKEELNRGALSSKRSTPPPTPPLTPSTRFSSSSSGGTPEPHAGVLGLGRHLGFDELVSVAEGIREALEGEHASLLASISEQVRLLEAEDARRAHSNGQVPLMEPSMEKLQGLIHKLQDVSVSPGPEAMQLSPQANSRRIPGSLSIIPEDAPPPPIVGGAQVRRLQALIAQRRCQTPLHELPDATLKEPYAFREAEVADGGGREQNSAAGPPKPVLDPFFDDPFA